jgi:hypothetical protein
MRFAMKAIRAALVLATLSSPAYSQSLPLGYQQLTGMSSATKLTVPAGAAYAAICVETQAVRWRDDGTAPTASVGQPIPAGACMWYTAPLSNFQMIQQTSGAVADVSYYR